MRYLSILGALAMGAMIFISSQAIAWQDSMNMHGTDSTVTGRVSRSCMLYCNGSKAVPLISNALKNVLKLGRLLAF